MKRDVWFLFLRTLPLLLRSAKRYRSSESTSVSGGGKLCPNRNQTYSSIIIYNTSRVSEFATTDTVSQNYKLSFRFLKHRVLAFRL